ncbi:MAG TPA: type II and III secretion system protein family protein [Xanthobacteraceae bacterium]
MARTALTRTASLTMIAGFAVAAIGPIGAAEQRPGGANAPATEIVGSDLNSRFIPLGVGKSVVLDLPRDIKDVLIAEPKVANAVIRSARRAYIIGAGVGQTNIFFFDAEGRQIAGFEIAVTRNLNGIRAAIKQALPASDIQIEGVGEGVVLTGNVATSAEAQLAYDIAIRLLDYQTSKAAEEGSKVVNAITVQGRDQIMVKVTVAEVRRDVIKQLGVNFNASLGYGTSVLNLNTSNPFSAVGTALSTTALGGSGVAGTWKGVTATLLAMERAGVIHTLAEPTLTAISGESAAFLAGGQFPVPTGLNCSTTTNPPVCQPTIEFKQFGVSLNITPVVLSEGRISLKVLTEVSNLSTDNALTLQFPGSTQPLTVPSILTRRAETTVELPSGGSLAMAGMIQDQTVQQINGIPGLMQVPVLGTLFKSRDFINNQTELMVLVTPYVARAVALKDLSRPDDGFADASDPTTVLLGNLNRIYGVPGKPGNAESKGSYRGNYGFILD